MSGRKSHASDEPNIEKLIEEITIDAYGDDEQFWAFRQAFEDQVDLPADGFVLGEPVSVVVIDYDGNPRRGLTATCRKEDRGEHVIALADVVFRDGTTAALYLAAYRKWAGLSSTSLSPPPRKKHRAQEEDIDVSKPIDLIVLNVKQQTARCRIPGTGRVVTLRSRDAWRTAPGEILTVRANKYWRYSGNPYLSGIVESRRIDIPALGLHPLRLEERGIWNPADEYRGEEGEPLSDWEEQIIRRGPRPSLEMEQVIPGANPEDPFDDPITRSNDLKMAGDLDEAYRLLMEMAEADLRCLDAHCHLGNLAFDRRVEDALRHYEIGMRIGELSLGDSFGDVLLWTCLDNRPFLRCLNGYGLCLWRLGRSDEAAEVFERMLWLNPPDNQGNRFLLADVKAGKSWEGEEGEYER